MIIFIKKMIEVSVSNVDLIVSTSAFLLLCWLFALQKRYGSAITMFIMAFFAVLFYNGMGAWVYGLGGDSFLEASNFNISEACSWIRAFVLSLWYMASSPKFAGFILGVALVLSLLLVFLVKRQKYAVTLIVALLFCVHLELSYKAYEGFKLTRQYVTETKEIFAEPVTGMSKAADMDFVVYVGESTTTLNMSLYGYPLRTTPRLDALQAEDPGFVKFNSIRSTHTHTSLLLLRALSTPSPVGTLKKRWGLGKIFENAGVKARLFSVQPLTGSFSTFSKFIFDGLEYELNEHDKYRGNMVPPPYQRSWLYYASIKRIWSNRISFLRRT